MSTMINFIEVTLASESFYSTLIFFKELMIGARINSEIPNRVDKLRMIWIYPVRPTSIRITMI